jgi:uncharacterized membrane protein YsdA (DUF1294 family)
MRIIDWQIYLIWLATVSIITFVVYGYDKAQAKRNGRRVPEKHLHWLALLGGFPGGWLGRFLFRHKTRKGMFLLILVISTVLHLGLAGWLYFR